MKRSPLRRKTGLRPVSDKQRTRLAGLAIERARLRERSLGYCEAGQAHYLPECTGRYEHAHHIRRRSQGGTDTAENLLALCHAHHEWVHRNPVKAAKLGFLHLTGDVS